MSSVFSDGAKRKLLDIIKRKGALSLEEAVDDLALAKTTVRQHLLLMEDQGLVQRTYERVGQGRPKVLFELTLKAKQLYPTQDPKLLRKLLEFLIESGQQKSIELFFEKYWDQRKSQFMQELDRTKDQSKELSSPKTELNMRMETLRFVLQSEGFMPELKKQGTNFEVRECHCPYPEAIRATQVPCKLESEFIQWALKIPMERTAYFPRGDLACAYQPQKTNKRKRQG